MDLRGAGQQPGGGGLGCPGLAVDVAQYRAMGCAAWGECCQSYFFYFINASDLPRSTVNPCLLPISLLAIFKMVKLTHLCARTNRLSCVQQSTKDSLLDVAGSTLGLSAGQSLQQAVVIRGGGFAGRASPLLDRTR